MRNLTPKRIEVDEIWSFCYAKAKNVPGQHEGEWGYGDVWTWVAMDPETKLLALWFVGTRDGLSGRIFIDEVRTRLTGRFQLTSDGHHAYMEAVRGLFKDDIDYAQLVKLYGPDPTDTGRYSPAACLGATKKVRFGIPTKTRFRLRWSNDRTSQCECA